MHGNIRPTLRQRLRHALFATGCAIAACGAVFSSQAAEPAFDACVATLRTAATARGIPAATFDRLTGGLEPDLTVIEANRNQPEFKTPIWDYLAALVDDERVADGRAKLAEWDAVLGTVEQKFGVDRHTVVAVWGVESDFGRLSGGRPLVRSLATGACLGTRQRYFRDEFLALLKIIEDGEIAADALVGSWAGAFGHTQFMPTTFLRTAVDVDGDGRRDVVGSIPDALGSTANYLKRAGWVTGAPWGYEVKVPANYAGPSGRRNRQPLAQFAASGVRRADGAALDGPATAALLLPAGAPGPAFIVFRNFDAIFAYNAAESYALAIAHLADRLRGGGAFSTPWPTDDRGLSRAERREVQRLLIARGHEIGAPDGLIGAKTRAAITEVQSKLGLKADGRAGGKLLEALREPRDRKP